MTSPSPPKQLPPPLRRSKRHLTVKDPQVPTVKHDTSPSKPPTPSTAPSPKANMTAQKSTPQEQPSTPRNHKMSAGRGLGGRTPATKVPVRGRTGYWGSEVKQIRAAIQQGKQKSQLTIKSAGGTSKRVQNFPLYSLGAVPVHGIPEELRVDYDHLPIIPKEYGDKLLGVIVREQIGDAANQYSIRLDCQGKSSKQIASHIRSMVNASYHVDWKDLMQYEMGPVIEQIRQAQEPSPSSSASVAVASAAEVSDMKGDIAAFVGAVSVRSNKQDAMMEKHDTLIEGLLECNKKQDALIEQQHERSNKQETMIEELREGNKKQETFNKSLTSIVNENSRRVSNIEQGHSRLERDLSRLQNDYQDLQQGFEVVKEKCLQMTPRSRTAFTPKKIAWKAFAYQDQGPSAGARALGSKVLDFGCALESLDENGEEEDGVCIQVRASDDSGDDDRKPAAINFEANAKKGGTDGDDHGLRGQASDDSGDDDRKPAATNFETNAKKAGNGEGETINVSQAADDRGDESKTAAFSEYDARRAAAMGTMRLTDSSQSWTKNADDDSAASRKELDSLKATGIFSEAKSPIKRDHQEVDDDDSDDEEEEKVEEAEGLVGEEVGGKEDSEDPSVAASAAEGSTGPSSTDAAPPKSSMFSMGFWFRGA